MEPDEITDFTFVPVDDLDSDNTPPPGERSYRLSCRYRGEKATTTVTVTDHFLTDAGVADRVEILKGFLQEWCRNNWPPPHLWARGGWRPDSEQA